VNAVLRGFARSAEQRPRLPADPIERLAVRCSFPTWLCARWVARFGEPDAERLMLAMNDRPPLTVRANTLRTTREALAARLEAEEDVRATPTSRAPEGLEVEHGGAPGRWKALTDGEAVPQDEASMLVSRLLDPQPGDLVADACAAPGTKTTHLAALMRDRGRIVAFDPQPARLALVERAAARLGVTIVETREGPVEALAPALAERCDRVLVDAPCSNLGVLRRNPEVKWRRAPGDVLVAADRQRGILEAAASMVRPGGWLVYATCSLEPEENEQVVHEFLTARAGWHVDAPAEPALPLDADGVLRCLPHVHGTDGFTAVRLRRGR
jgi:16S rRNA (cytosine967-C5)-methyltransferase